jgi:sigma-E factor negative regulatory protein RseA
MSEQIREQVSAFLDGELPSSETELLLKRLTRDVDLRESFGRYALIGEILRGTESGVGRYPLSRGFAAGVNAAINGEAAPGGSPSIQARAPRWWRPVAGAAVAAGVAAVAVVALQQRTVAPSVRTVVPVMAQNVAQSVAKPKEALSYTVPAVAPADESPPMLPAARLTSYVFAHSRYSSVLGQSNVLSGLLADADEQAPPDSRAVELPAVNRTVGNDAAPPRSSRDPRIAP